MERDMTVGNPTSVILNFSIPIFLGNIFQQCYSMADTIIVGKFVGTNALAAVGSTGTIMFLIIISLIGLTTGFTVMTAQRFGAGDIKGMRKTVTMAAILSAIISVLITIISTLCMKPLLILMNTPEDIFSDAYIYIMIICFGIVAQVLYNLLSSILRALGNSKVPLYFLILAALLNIVLDLVLIIVFQMGVAGAALATVISQGVSGLLCLVYIVKSVPILKLERDDWHMDWKMARIQLSIGLPMAFQYSITAIGTMMVQSALNILGSTTVAAFTAASKIEQLVSQAFVAMGTTLSTYAAQNIGAGKIKRIRQGFSSATIMSCIYAVITGILLATVGKYLTILFLSGDLTEILGSVDVYLKCAGIFFIPLAIVNLYRPGIQGMGYGLLPMMAGIAELVGRGITAIIASRYESYLGICMASPVAWIFAALLLIVTYYYVIHQKSKQEKTL